MSMQGFVCVRERDTEATGLEDEEKGAEELGSHCSPSPPALPASN